MQFTVGYQLPDEGRETFVDIVKDYKDVIGEVYFPWPGIATGRAALNVSRGIVDWMTQATLERDLHELKSMGMKLDLLLNANCNGQYASSQFLENQVGSLITHLYDILDGVDIVTTASPAIAHILKKHFPDIEVRASVNMRIGTYQGFEYSKSIFDSYCLQRDNQRNLDYLKNMKALADSMGKSLVLLANSGCFRYCPGQTFHDNMVAHEQEIDEVAPLEKWIPHTCWRHLKQRENWSAILQATWIRPEDLKHYADIVPTIKLATRMHQNPRMVIHAYATGKHYGNLVDLFEPGHGPAIAPYVIDNTLFPENWFDKTSTCNSFCPTCNYCKNTLEKVLVNYDDFV